jgi:hypothetical protein
VKKLLMTMVMLATLASLTTARDQQMTITYRAGEYRVNFQYGQECTAYYTADLGDAYDTGIAMSATGMVFGEDCEQLGGINV